MATSRRPRRRNPMEAGSNTEPDEVAQFRAELEALGVPAEALELLDGVTDADEAVRRLAEAGVLPSQEDALDRMLKGWDALLSEGGNALDAELCGAEFLQLLGQVSEGDAAVLQSMIENLAAQAQTSRRPAALAMLRVLAELGPEEVRPVSSEAADRLVATGLTDPAWVGDLGAPEVGRCFGYADGLGGQETVFLTFRYRRRRHGVAVLLDHYLGGGVKDCFFTDTPDRARAQYRRAAAAGGLELQDYSPEVVRELLDRALAQSPCPVDADQIEDVAMYLGLLRRRVALLPESGPAHTPKRGAGRRTPTVHRIKVGLRGAKPPIWRRIEVPSTVTLYRLHDAIQRGFGWHGGHLWVFTTGDAEYGTPDPELGHLSASSVRLRDVAGEPGDRIRYTYDFGDDWEHDISVEEVSPAEGGVAYPRCTGGRRACPPEDCGGIWGYENLLAVLASPEDPQHTDMLEWLGLETADQFDPSSFDQDEVTARLSRQARVLAR